MFYKLVIKEPQKLLQPSLLLRKKFVLMLIFFLTDSVTEANLLILFLHIPHR